MPELHLPWLELMVLIPAMAALIVAPLRSQDLARKISIAATGAAMICATGEWLDFAALHAFEAHDHWDVVQWLFHRDVFVIDELSAPLLPLGALLYFTTVLTTLRTKMNRFSFAWTLASESILLALLACRSSWGIIALLSLSVIHPLVEQRRRGQNVRVFVFHMGLSIVLLVVGQLFMTWATEDSALFLTGGCMLTAGVLVRSGICPLHCWITDLFEKATFGTALLFVTPMTGAYAVMRLVFPVAPPWALQSIAVLSLITAVYAAGMAIVQTDARRLFCYLFLSHSSLVLVGIEMATPIGLAGGLCVWLSVGMSLLGFGLALRSVEARTGRLTLNVFHGLYEQTPFLAGMFLLTSLSSIGFPGTVGFIGTELLIEGAIDVYPLVGLAVVVAAALNGIAVLRAYFRVFAGSRHAVTGAMGCRRSERVTIIALCTLVLVGGIWPQPGVQSRYHAAEALINHRRTPDLIGAGSKNEPSGGGHADQSD